MADNLLAVCEPRSDVLQGALEESDFGMAIHRKHPRRVLMAMRFLLIEPRL